MEKQRGAGTLDLWSMGKTFMSWLLSLTRERSNWKHGSIVGSVTYCFCREPEFTPSIYSGGAQPSITPTPREALLWPLWALLSKTCTKTYIHILKIKSVNKSRNKVKEKIVWKWMKRQNPKIHKTDQRHRLINYTTTHESGIWKYG